MNENLKQIREYWSASKTYRVLLIAAIVYAVLRLAIQIFLFSDALQTEAVAEGASSLSRFTAVLYCSAQHFQAREDLYLKGSLEACRVHIICIPLPLHFSSHRSSSPLNSVAADG